MTLHPAVAAVRLGVRRCLAALPPAQSPATERVAVVACSGGADSLALLAATVFEARATGDRVVGVTVDHGLQEGSADQARHTVAQMQALGAAETYVVTVTVEGEGQGPEAAARQAATAQLAGHLDQHTQALVLLLRALDAKHGSAAHSTALRARGAALEARLWAVGLELLLWETRARLYPPEAQPALRAYRRHLRDAGMRLQDDARAREQELHEFGVAVPPGDDGHDEDDEVRGHGGDEDKERTMREMARVWNDMQARLAEVRGDLQRLDGT